MTEPATTLKQSVGRLDVQRKSLEMEGEAIISELTATPESGGEPMGIDTPLVDLDGYPRGDVDVHRARDLRGRLSVIKTDRKGIMEAIDKTLAQVALVQNPKKSEEESKEQAARSMTKPKPKYDAKTGKWVVMNWDGTVAGVENGDNLSFENLNENRSNNNNQQTTTTPTSSFGQMDIDNEASPSSTARTPPITTIPPCFKIDGVANLSPASEAGLKEGDLITNFGSINHSNASLSALMPVVASAADSQKAISITLLRQTTQADKKEIVQVALVPKPWPGRGLIGCHIILYSESS